VVPWAGFGIGKDWGQGKIDEMYEMYEMSEMSEMAEMGVKQEMTLVGLAHPFSSPASQPK
jgi:hypothetical protein